MSVENKRDAAFDTMSTIPNATDFLKNWKKDAAAYRASGVDLVADIPYGSGRREVFDLVSPDEAPRGLVVSVHGAAELCARAGFADPGDDPSGCARD